MNNMGSEECRIQVNEGDWVRQMEKELKEQNSREESKRWEAMSIFRIPSSLKNLSKQAYQPQMVAIGPYHHGEEQLEEMEEHKKRALRTFLQRSEKSLDHYVNALTLILQDLKNAYHQLPPELQCGDFLKMMVLDGCFLLELLRTQERTSANKELLRIQKRTTDQTSTNKEILQQPSTEQEELLQTLQQISSRHESYISDYKSNDPVFSKHGHIYFGPHLKRDMLMLENQIPLKVLTTLVVAEKGSWEENDVIKIILLFFDRSDQIDLVKKGKFKKCLHILDLYRACLLSFDDKETNRSGGRCRERVWGMFQGKKEEEEEEYNMRPATELEEAGIKCKRVSSTYLDEITFDGGKLMLPSMKVDDATKTVYLNMMAFERFHVNRWVGNDKEGNQVTSYVYFMDRLIDTAKDVSLLHKRHIVDNSLGSDQSVAEMFNSMSTDICLAREDKLRRVQNEVAKYYRMPVPGCMAYAQRTYFTNPWVSLSLVAAIFLFALTISQTVYAVLDFHKPDKPK